MIGYIKNILERLEREREILRSNEGQRFTNMQKLQIVVKTLNISSFTLHNLIKRFREYGRNICMQSLKSILDLQALRRRCTKDRHVMEIIAWAIHKVKILSWKEDASKLTLNDVLHLLQKRGSVEESSCWTCLFSGQLNFQQLKTFGLSLIIKQRRNRNVEQLCQITIKYTPL